MSDEPRTYRVIDLFSGAGGLTLGFSQKMGMPFAPVWANDFNKGAVATYNHNFGDHCHPGDILHLLANPQTEIPQADLVIGGPPCQGFSLLNRNRDNDPRKQMWRPFLDVVRRSGASVFVMENVPQLLGSDEFTEIKEEAATMGFRLAYQVLFAPDYGVPQIRKRAFIVGCTFADPAGVFPPPKTHQRPGTGAAERAGVPLWRTVRDAIGDLDAPVGTAIRSVDPPLDLHFGRTPTEISLRRYRAIPDEGMNRFDLHKNAPDITPQCWINKKSGGTDLFGRLWWDRPAFTIRTEFFKPEKGRYLHPVQDRPMTHREAARFQTFPDDFHFCGSKIEIARQIGNAVPPLLARAVAGCVVELLAQEPVTGAEQTAAPLAPTTRPLG